MLYNQLCEILQNIHNTNVIVISRQEQETQKQVCQAVSFGILELHLKETMYSLGWVPRKVTTGILLATI